MRLINFSFSIVKQRPSTEFFDVCDDKWINYGLLAGSVENADVSQEKGQLFTARFGFPDHFFKHFAGGDNACAEQVNGLPLIGGVIPFLRYRIPKDVFTPTDNKYFTVGIGHRDEHSVIGQFDRVTTRRIT